MEFWGIVFFTFFVLIGIGVALYFIITKVILKGCGEEGKKPCIAKGCKEGLVEDGEGICRSAENPLCGTEGAEPCVSTGCNTGLVLGEASGVCELPSCGGESQPPCASDGGCGEGLSPAENGVCVRVCSTEGHEPCKDKECDEGLMEGVAGKCVKTARAVGGFLGIAAAGFIVMTGLVYLLYRRGRGLFAWARSGLRRGRVQTGGDTEDEKETSLDAMVKTMASTGILNNRSNASAQAYFDALVATMKLIRSDPRFSPDQKDRAIGDILAYTTKLVENPPAAGTDIDIRAMRSEMPEVASLGVLQQGILQGKAREVLKKIPANIKTMPQLQAKLAAEFPSLDANVKQEVENIFQVERMLAQRPLTQEEQELVQKAKGGATDFAKNAPSVADLVGLPKSLTERASKFLDPNSPAERLLLYGPPGTGKTMWVKALVAQDSADTFVFTFDPSNLTGEFGGAEREFKAMMAAARQMRLRGKKVVVFMDEVDDLLKAFPSMKGTIQTTLDQFDDIPVVLNTNYKRALPGSLKNRTVPVLVKELGERGRMHFLTQHLAGIRDKLSFGGKDHSEIIERLAKQVEFNGRSGVLAMKKLMQEAEVTEEKLRKALEEAVGQDKAERKERKTFWKRLMSSSRSGADRE